jgi:cardiolipin synthase
MRGFPLWGVGSLPHWLSLVRVPLAVAVWLAPERPLYLFAMLALSGLSDWLDGMAARWLRPRELRRGVPQAELDARSTVGAWLDPLSDKAFVLSAVGAVYVAYQPPLALLLLVATRDLLLAPLLVIYRLVPWLWERHQFTARWPGKLTTVVQFVALALVVLRSPLFEPLAWIAAGLGVFTVGFYAHRAWTVPAHEQS